MRQWFKFFLFGFILYFSVLFGVLGCTFDHIDKRDTKVKVQNECVSKKFNHLLNRAENQTELGNLQEALQSYRKAYEICPMKNIEEQMAWLLSEIVD